MTMEQEVKVRKVRKLVLYSGVVGDFDGAYNWVRPGQEDDPEYTLGSHHESAWLEDHYTTVVEVSE